MDQKEIMQIIPHRDNMLLVEEAGGQVTDFSGRPIDKTRPADILAENGRIGGQIREALS